MDVVKAFNSELASLYELRPPISKKKMVDITKGAMKAIKYYKHVVQSVEKFIQRCKAEYKIPGLYVIDSIVRQSRHQFGVDKDVFGPRFGRNLSSTFECLLQCGDDEKLKLVRVLNLWMKNQVFTTDVVAPLLVIAKDHGLETDALPVEKVSKGNSLTPAVYQPPAAQADVGARRETHQDTLEAEALAAAAEEHSTGNGIDSNLDPALMQQIQSLTHTLLSAQHEQQQKQERERKGAIKNLLSRDYQYSDESDEDAADTSPHKAPAQSVAVGAADAGAATAAEDLLRNPDILERIQEFQQRRMDRVAGGGGGGNALSSQTTLPSPPKQPQFNSAPPVVAPTPPKLAPMAGALPPPDFSKPPPGFPGAPPFVPPINLRLPPPPSAFERPLPQPGGNLPHNFDRFVPPPQAVDRDDRSLRHARPPGEPLPPGEATGPPQPFAPIPNMFELRHHYDSDERRHRDRDERRRRKKRSTSRELETAEDERGYKRRRRSRSRGGADDSRSRERGRDKDDRRRGRHRRSRSNSADRDRERERRKQGIPPLRADHVSILSRTLWLGRLPPTCGEDDIRAALRDVGEPARVDVVAPRGCAYVTMPDRKSAYRVVDGHGLRVCNKQIKLAWATGRGLKDSAYQDMWNADLGVSFIPWNKLPDDLSALLEEAALDLSSLPEDLKGKYTEKGLVGVEASTSQGTPTKDEGAASTTPQPPFTMPTVPFPMPMPGMPGFPFPPPFMRMGMPPGAPPMPLPPMPPGGGAPPAAMPPMQSPVGRPPLMPPNMRMPPPSMGPPPMRPPQMRSPANVEEVPRPPRPPMWTRPDGPPPPLMDSGGGGFRGGRVQFEIRGRPPTPRGAFRGGGRFPRGGGGEFRGDRPQWEAPTHDNGGATRPRDDWTPRAPEGERRERVSRWGSGDDVAAPPSSSDEDQESLALAAMGLPVGFGGDKGGPTWFAAANPTDDERPTQQQSPSMRTDAADEGAPDHQQTASSEAAG